MSDTKPLLNFHWQGFNPQGDAISGYLKMPSIAHARHELSKKNVQVTQIKRHSNRSFNLFEKKITSSDISFFTRQLCTLFKAGIPLVQSFDVIKLGSDNPSMKQLLEQIKNNVSSGDTLADSLKKYPKYFNELYCNLIKAGEQSGGLDVILERLAIYREKTEAMRKKINKALMYPMFTLAVSVIVSLVLIIKVIPTFQNFFKDFNSEPPALTQFFFGLSHWFQNEGWMHIILFFGIFILLKLITNSSIFLTYQWHRLLLKLPLIGHTITVASVSHFSRVLSTCFSSGTTLVNAMGYASGVMKNRLFYQSILTAQKDVSGGRSLYNSLTSSGLFPDMMLQMVSIGEESGSLDQMLSRTADHYEKTLDDAFDKMTGLFEPIIISFLGVVLGGLIIAMYLPIFKMGSAI